jgi:pimeloyl-ACP methyl ester carboxylesterase
MKKPRLHPSSSFVILSAAKDPVRRSLPHDVLTSLSLIVCVTLLLLMLTPSFAAEPAPDLFAYDKAAPFNLQEVGRETRDAALIRDLTFRPADTPVKAYLVTPAAGTGPHAAILYVHWLGEPTTTNRTEFLAEAVALAGRGVVSLLVDCMWAEPQWYKQRIPEEDYARSVRQVIELRRAFDLLLAQPDIDPTRVALVGHDFGAMYGLIAAAQDQRVRTCVLMACVPRLIDWFLYSRQPVDLVAYRQQLAPLDPIHFVPKLAPASVYFQFANQDEYVSPAQSAEYYAAALPRKQLTTYFAGHDLLPPEVAADRLTWLERELKLPQ